MNSANPFQIPSCFQNVDEQRRRERFRKGVIATIAAVVLLLVGLLIQGCKSERSSASVTPVPQTAAAPAAPVVQKTALVPMPGSQSVMPQPNVQTARMTPTISPSASLYVVKSGDTLGRIAKAHNVSVKSLRSLNGLSDDHIAVGAKLKIPTA